MIPFLLLLFFGCCDPRGESPYSLFLEAKWDSTPYIEICDDLPKSAKNILGELDFWKELSNDYIYEENFRYSDCSEPLAAGWIRFTKADKEILKKYGWRAYTYQAIDLYNDDLMVAAEVSLTSKNNQWVVRHEIGHAWGWGHSAEEGHLMYECSGHDTWGLERYDLEVFGDK